VRTLVERHLRRRLPSIELATGGRWNLTHRVDGCCAGYTSYATAALAAEHWRSGAHVAIEHRARRSTVLGLGQQVLWAHGTDLKRGAPRDATSLVGTCLKTRADLELLWQAGLTTELIAHVHSVASHGRPLPANFYLGVLSKRPDLKWIHDSAVRTPERDVHEWLAWTETDEDRAQPQKRGDWLELGISLRDVAVLSTTTYTPANVEDLAQRTRRSTTAAGGLLAAWVNAECFPSIPGLIAICELSEGQPERVTRAAVDTVAELSGITGPREHLAFALTLCGAASLAASLITATHSLEPADLLRGMADWESARTRKKPQHA
jgi:hypothetical protein